MADTIGETVLAAQQQARAAEAGNFLESFSGVEPEEPTAPQTEGGEKSLARQALSDIGTGITEVPAQIAGGVADAFNATMSGMNDLNNFVNEKLSDAIGVEPTPREVLVKPEVGEAESVTGGMVRGISQFLSGFAGGSKIVGGLSSATVKGAAVKGSGAAAVSDFAAFDGHEERLSDLIESNPALSNPITEYLASDMEDSELEGRLKNVAEGALSDVLLGGLISAVRTVRRARQAREGVGAETYEEAAQRLTTDPEVVQGFAPDLGGIGVRSELPAVASKTDDEAAGEIEAFLRELDSQAADIDPDTIVREGTNEPLPLFHGTNVEFEEFADGLTFFSSRRGLAVDHAMRQGLGNGRPRVVEANVALKDPVKVGPVKDDPDTYWLSNTRELEQRMADEGKDGIMVWNEDGELLVIASRNDQIKQVNKEGDAPKPLPQPENPNLSRVRAGGNDIVINWSRINGPDELKVAMQRVADEAASEINSARGGRVTNAATELNADQLDAWQVLQERRVGSPLNAEQSLAARRLWASSGQNLIAAARRAKEAPTAANRFAFRRSMAMHQAVQREVIAARTETARALQQWAIPAGSDREMMRQIRETVDQFGGETSDEMADRILQAADEGNLAAVDQMARRSPLAASTDAVTEYWTNSILSGPKTHLVNMLSNTGVIGLLQVERLVGRGIGVARGGGRDAIQAGEAMAALHGTIASIPDAFRFAGKAWRSGGQSGFGMGKVELPYRRAISSEQLGSTSSKRFNAVMNQPVIARGIDALGALVTVPGRALGTADEFFKTVNYRAEIHALAVRQAREDARVGRIDQSEIKERMAELIADPDENMRIVARDQAQYATFTNDPGRYARMITDLRHKAPILRFVVPFVNTPANILRFAFERSPGAPLLGDVRADIAAGGARRDMALARMGLGSMTMLWAFDQAMNGRITGSGPSNPTEKAALRRMGWQPYSVKVGDRYYAFNRLDPLGFQLGVAGEMAEIALNTEEDPGAQWDETIYRTIGAVGQNMMDRTYLTGVSDLVSALSEPERFAPTYFERLASSFVPTAGREVAAFIDPEMKRSSDTLERIKERIPGLRSEVTTRHDLWGRPISYQSGLGAGYDAVSPIYSSRSDPEPIDQELQRIDYFPSGPSSSITINRERFSLRNNPEAYERYVVLQGATPASALPTEGETEEDMTASDKRLRVNGDMSLREALNALVQGQHPSSADYSDADQFGKEDLIRRMISDYRRAAKRKLIGEFPDAFEPGEGKR